MSHVTGRDTTTASIGQRVDLYAAERGEQVATVRKRIQRGQLVGYKGADHRWYVLPDDATDATHDRTHDATGQDRTRDRRQESVASVAVNPNARAQLEAIRDEWLQPLVETIARQAEQIGRLQAERDGATSQLLAKDQTIAAREQALAADALTIAELRRRAEVAEAERDRLAVAQAAQAGPGAPEASPEAQGRRFRRVGASAPLVGALRIAGRRAIAALPGRVVVTLVFLLDPATPVLRIRSTGVGAPVSPVLVVLLLALAGGAIWLWTRRDPPDEGG